MVLILVISLHGGKYNFQMIYDVLILHLKNSGSNEKNKKGPPRTAVSVSVKR